MFSTGMVLVGLILTIAILSSIPKIKSPGGRVGVGLTALLVFVIFFAMSSIRYIGENEVGVVIKNALGPSLPEGKIIATHGEMGPQAQTLPPGWHFWLWPVIYNVEMNPLVEISENEVGLLTAVDGAPLEPGQVFAPEWNPADAGRMLDAQYFLTDGGGFKGPQTSVLKPGKHRINPKLFRVETVPLTNIKKATAGVIKSNVGSEPASDTGSRLVNQNERGIWKTPLGEDKYYLNTKAYEVTTVSTGQRTVRYTASAAAGSGSDSDQREITVRSSDGFTFPVDVRIEYQIKPADAPIVVAEFEDDGTKLTQRLDSVVRSVFRNNGENVKALDYVQQRSQQEAQSLAMIIDQMRPFGVTVTAVRIGDVGDEQSLGTLLKTQTDRELAKQEQVTFQEQQRAAEQQKALSRTRQEAEEEKRLATAQYEVEVAKLDAQAQAERIRVQADAQAEAFRVIAEQIGRGNAAMIELLKIVGERGVRITPSVMVVGDSGADAESTALIGTMLNQMVQGGDENR